MKKIFTFIVACVAAVSAMAQAHGTMNFVGDADFWSGEKNATFTTQVKDVVQVIMGDNDTQSIIIPDMAFDKEGLQATIKSFAISGLTYTMSSDQSGMVISWTSDKTTSTTTGTDGEAKSITVSDLKATYTHATEVLTVTFTLKYESIAKDVVYSFKGYYTDSENKWQLVGRGTEANPYRIFDAADFTAMATNYNAETNTGKGEYFLMMNDVDFGGSAENPVQLPAIGKNADLSIAKMKGGFDGIFDGDNHNIKGIYHTNIANDAAGKYNALFSLTDVNAVIKNIRIDKNNHICGYNYVGGIVSINQGTIENCINNADITAANLDAAGICGFMANGVGTITNCSNAGNITSTTYAAGICSGSQSGSSITSYNYLITSCTNYGKIVSTNGVGAAGIAGSFSGAIKNCDNYGNVDDSKGTGKNIQYTAGIVSCPSYAIVIENCKNEGAISGGKSVGGIVANVMKGENEDVVIYNCTNNGSVSATGENVGGIVGNSARTAGKVSVEGCTNRGSVTSTGTTSLLGNIRGSESITIGSDNSISTSLEKLPLDTDNIATGIEDVNAKENATAKDGKYLKNGQIVIVKNGKTYNVLGIEQ